jgi:hypothetical protein
MLRRSKSVVIFYLLMGSATDDCRGRSLLSDCKLYSFRLLGSVTKPPLSSVVSFRRAAHETGHDPVVEQGRTLPRCHRVSSADTVRSGGDTQQTLTEYKEEVYTFMVSLSLPLKDLLLLSVGCNLHVSLTAPVIQWRSHTTLLSTN